MPSEERGIPMRTMNTAFVAMLATASMSLADTYTIGISGMSFDPSSLDVQPGDEVIFEITGMHTATSGSSCVSDGVFDYSSGTHTWTVPDSLAGTTVDYFCDPHCSMGMTGVINVAGLGGGNTLALASVSSAAADSFYWERNDSISGDTFHIVTDSHHPYQIALEVEGSWDIDLVTATNVYLYTVGSGSTLLSAGTVTLGDGYHILHNDPSSASELEVDLPGPSLLGPGSEPLWNVVEVMHGYVEWKQFNGINTYRFMGNNAASSLDAELNQPGGTGEIDVSYIGDTACSSISLPAEIEEASVSVSAGTHDFTAGTSGSGPWALYVAIGDVPEFCDEDVNQDGQVGIDDLLQVMGSWGACP